MAASSEHPQADFPALTDTYLIVNAAEGLEPGAYYYNRDSRAFELLKAGNFRGEAGYLCLEQPLGMDCSALVVYMADLERALSAFGNRGYGDVHLEAGILGGRAYLAAYSLGRGATGLTFYDDDTTKFFEPHAAGKSPLLMVALGSSPLANEIVSSLENRAFAHDCECLRSRSDYVYPIRSGYSFAEVDCSMNLPEFQNLDLSIARARIALSLIAMLSLYVDPSTAGGLFHLNAYALTTLLCHLAYSVGMYFALTRRYADWNLQVLSTCFDLFFATAIAFITEGQTSASFVFFVFAIIAAGNRAKSRPIVTVTVCSVALYLLVIILTQGLTSVYDMRAVYLAIAGYLIGFFSQQRALFEAEVRELETRTERQSIARSLHDGYVQALAGVNLRLETCRALLNRNRPQDALVEITDLQAGVAREYDAVRIYLRSLAGIDQRPTAEFAARASDPSFEVRAAFSGGSLLGEHILQIMLEGLRNSRSHGLANLVKIEVREVEDKVSITIEDDGVGLSDSSSRPWAIASRVAELEGHMSMHSDGSTRLQIELPNS